MVPSQVDLIMWHWNHQESSLFDDGVIHNTDEANTKEVCTHSSDVVPLDADVHRMNTDIAVLINQLRNYAVLLHIICSLETS